MDNVIEIKNLKKYFGKSRGISDVSMSIPKGKVYGFVGPNGAGKSTTIKILLDFIRSDEGIATVLGYDVQKDSKTIKEKIGYVSSDVRYYSNMKVKQIINNTLGYYGLEYSKEIDEMIKYLNIDVDKKIGNLSLGNKKKIGIVCALVHNPELIILDEPTSGLDPLIKKRLFDLLLERVKRGATIFLSSHDLTEVENYCDEVAFIKDGKIIKTQDLSVEGYQHVKSVTIKGNVSKENFKDIDIKVIEKDNNRIKFLYRDDIKKLLNIINDCSVEDIIIDNLSLEEEFMSYYEVDNNESI